MEDRLEYPLRRPLDLKGFSVARLPIILLQRQLDPLDCSSSARLLL